MRGRLIELICEKLQDGCECHCNHPPCMQCEVIADHLLANGVIVPFCKPGDTLWHLDYGLPQCFISPEKLIVQDIVITTQVVFIRCNKETLRIEDFGKTVFLTREEAERALKGGEEE